MFWTLIYPFQEFATMLLNYHISCFVLGLLCVGDLVQLSLSGVRVAGWSLQYGHHSNPATPNHQHTTNREQNNWCGNLTAKLQALVMDILMSKTCWAHKKWNKIASDNKLVLYSSTITMMHGPINKRFTNLYARLTPTFTNVLAHKGWWYNHCTRI